MDRKLGKRDGVDFGDSSERCVCRQLSRRSLCLNVTLAQGLPGLRQEEMMATTPDEKSAAHDGIRI